MLPHKLLRGGANCPCTLLHDRPSLQYQVNTYRPIPLESNSDLRDKSSRYMNDILHLYEGASKDATAIASVEGDAINYETLVECAESCGDSLARSGISGDDRVAIVMRNGSLMAMTFASAVPWCAVAPLNPAYTADEFDYYLKDLEADLLLVEAGFHSPVLDVANNLGIRTIEIDAALGSEGLTFGPDGESRQRTHIGQHRTDSAYVRHDFETQDGAAVAEKPTGVSTEHRVHA